MENMTMPGGSIDAERVIAFAPEPAAASNAGRRIRAIVDKVGITADEHWTIFDPNAGLFRDVRLNQLMDDFEDTAEAIDKARSSSRA